MPKTSAKRAKSGFGQLAGRDDGRERSRGQPTRRSRKPSPRDAGGRARPSNRASIVAGLGEPARRCVRATAPGRSSSPRRSRSSSSTAHYQPSPRPAAASRSTSPTSRCRGRRRWPSSPGCATARAAPPRALDLARASRSSWPGSSRRSCGRASNDPAYPTGLARRQRAEVPRVCMLLAPGGRAAPAAAGATCVLFFVGIRPVWSTFLTRHRAPAVPRRRERLRRPPAAAARAVVRRRARARRALRRGARARARQRSLAGRWRRRLDRRLPSPAGSASRSPRRSTASAGSVARRGDALGGRAQHVSACRCDGSSRSPSSSRPSAIAAVSLRGSAVTAFLSFSASSAGPEDARRTSRPTRSARCSATSA